MYNLRHSFHRAALVFAIAFLAAAAVPAQQGYKKAPKEVLDVLNAPVTPTVSISPSRDVMLMATGVRYPPLADLAEPMVRLAGLRINPNTNGRHRFPYYVVLSLKRIADGTETKISLPPDAKVSLPQWSADGKRFAFMNTTRSAIELWVGDTATGKVNKVKDVTLNGVSGDPIQWLPDSRTILALSVPAKRATAPAAPAVPREPNTQEGAGKSGPIRTFQDLLRTPHDEQLFQYYATSQIVFVDTANARIAEVGKPAIFDAVDVSPGGQHILVSRLQRPFSYLLPAFGFPKEVEVWDMSGKPVYKVARVPMADKVPIEGVITGPRGYRWRPTEPATLVWIEALDGGDPKTKVPHRDRLVSIKAPFSGSPTELTKTEHRFAGLQFGEKDGVMLVTDLERDKRWVKTVLLNADNPGTPAKLVWSRSSQDRYGNPGSPVTRTLPNGGRAMLQQGEYIYLVGAGASEEGDRPFLDRFSLQTLKSERIFHSDDDAYETIVGLLSDDAKRFVTRRETPAAPPNYFLRSTGDAAAAHASTPTRSTAMAMRPLTDFPDPAPQLRDIKKQLVTYKRADGVQCSFTLYLPPGYQAGTRLPTIVWAYPLEFTDAGTAGQVTGSTQRFTQIVGASHLFLLLQGYAVLDNATMPVVGNPETVNNTYVEQIVMSAKAAIDKATEMGVTDPERVGVGGHSYGAFMTANLLAHSDLFRAGVARSGAYNRTLTPFGFQSERRTLWEAPEMYIKVSPFMHSQKINEPVLLIHGEADNNTGTFPIQSERLYQAIRGNGGNVRLVMLPLEAHGYAARESIEHVLFEKIAWFDKYVKNASPREKKDEAAR